MSAECNCGGIMFADGNSHAATCPLGAHSRKRPLMDAQLKAIIVEEIGHRFRVFGGGHARDGSPVSHWTASGPMLFAMGVDVGAVVDVVAAFIERAAAEAAGK